MYYYGYRRRRKRPGPKKVKNGIKVRAKRGELGQGWLAKNWMDALYNSTYSSDAFPRGRTYARKGQVLSVDVKKGSVVAMVQGTAAKPYTMIMKVGIPGAEFWKCFARMLKEKPAYAAAILAGEMPGEVAGEMAARGFDLFPTRNELDISCGCETWSSMCKHAAAASYILAEEFDRNPLLYLKIRGIDKKEFLAMLDGEPEISTAPEPVAVSPPRHTHAVGWGALQNMPSDPNPPNLSGAHGGKESISVSGGLVPGFRISVPAVPEGRTRLPADPREFWAYRSGAADSYDSAQAPAEPAALPKMLGRFPMWHGEGQFITLMEGIYDTASRTGANAYLGIRPDKGSG